jgi:hypothetical protein
MRPADTDGDAWERQLAVYRSLPGTRKIELALEMSEDIRSVAVSGIRARHPSYSRADAEWAYRRLTFDAVEFAAAWPRAPLLEP